MFNNMDRDEYRESGVNFIEEEREKELWQTVQMNLHPRVIHFLREADATTVATATAGRVVTRHLQPRQTVYL